MKSIYLFNITLISVILLLVSLGYSQTITLSVQPSVLELDFNRYSVANVEFRFWNDKGSADALYKVEPDECLQNILFDYEREFIVAKGTTIQNPVVKYFKFKPDGTGDKTCRLIITGSPVNSSTQSSGVGVKYAIASKIIIHQPKLVSFPSPSTPSETSQRISESSQNISESFQPKPPQENPQENNRVTPENPKENKNLPAQEQKGEMEKSTFTAMFIKFVTSPIMILIALIVVVIVLVLKYSNFSFISILIPLILFSQLGYSQVETGINVSVNVTPAPAPPPTIRGLFIMAGAPALWGVFAIILLAIFITSYYLFLKKLTFTKVGLEELPGAVGDLVYKVIAILILLIIGSLIITLLI
jgi:hypothetical protein